MRGFPKSIAAVSLSLAKKMGDCPGSPHLFLSLVLLSTMLIGTAMAQPLTIPAGPDLFVTTPGSPPANDTWADTPAPLPAGFFGIFSGQPSDPVPAGTRLFLKGNPTGPLGNAPTSDFQICEPAGQFDEEALLAKHGVGDQRQNGGLSAVDTIVQRMTSASLPTIGSSATVPIELVSLNLVSVAPITVTYGGGAFSQFFDVFATEAGAQAPGTMTLTRDSVDGGYFDALLPVLANIHFENTVPTGPQAASDLPFQAQFQSRGTHGPSGTSVCWLIPEPSALALIGMALPGLLHRRRRGNAH